MMRESGCVPTRLSSAIFRAKATGLQLRRGWCDHREKIKAFPQAEGEAARAYAFVWAQSRSPLWSEKAPAERALQLGKIQNLRCALRRLNGAIVPADRVFSFWKQIGAARRRRGYVAGRLLREGCFMPAVGGGLCQLSNALYDVALQAGLEIVERHGHSRIVPGSAAQSGRDATVAWNYIDLRFRASQEFLIAAELTREELIVRLCGLAPLSAAKSFAAPAKQPQEIVDREFIDISAHSCATCGQTACFRHAPSAAHRTPKIAWLLDTVWPEFEEYLSRHRARGDELAIPLDGARWHHPGYAWDTHGFRCVHRATAATLWRAFAARRLARYGAKRLRHRLQCDETLAAVLGRRIAFDAAHLIVAQTFLPFLWRDGVLGGRSFDVLMTRLPLQVLHARLDAALARCPERSTLNEYRAPEEIVECESRALAAARKVITPHSEIASLFPVANAFLLPWKTADTPPHFSPDPQRRTVCFPGPTAARKGAFELREALRTLDCELLLCSGEHEGDGFWRGINAHRLASYDEALARAHVVVQPALVEDNPRHLLRALACGVPVIATSHCGLEQSDGVRTVPFGDAEALCETLARELASTNHNYA